MQGHTGAARLALKEHVPIYPVGIKGAFELLPKGTYIPRWWRGKATIIFGKPLKPVKTEYTYKKAQALTKRLMLAIAKLIGQKYRF